MKTALTLFAVALVLCSCRGGGSVHTERIDFERNSAFTGPHLQVFLNEDGLSVNTAEDAVDTQPGVTPLPGHEARNWTFLKVHEGGTSFVHALVSWDPVEPADYLMAGWWAEFPGQRPPHIAFEDSEQYSLVDGPEIDPAHPPELPLSGRASYAGMAGGLYTYVRGNGWGAAAGEYVLEEWEGRIALSADFAAGTIGGCIGCDGDLVTRRAHFAIFLGGELLDSEGVAAGYELHLGDAPFGPDGQISHPIVTVRHPARDVVLTDGHWGGVLSNRPDADGNPRLATGFAQALFAESDDSGGQFIGVFVAPSEVHGGSSQ